MSISFTITEPMISRQFSDAESKEIDAISVLDNTVTITYKSNTEKQYIFEGSVSFIPHIRAVLTNWNPDEISIGSVIAKARKSENLSIIKL